jgi:hypothetical protein
VPETSTDWRWWWTYIVVLGPAGHSGREDWLPSVGFWDFGVWSRIYWVEFSELEGVELDEEGEDDVEVVIEGRQAAS